jgi:alanyl-tRNA synthetase
LIKKENNLILHFAKQLLENIEAGFVVVNTDLRTSTSKNHSATLDAFGFEIF